MSEQISHDSILGDDSGIPGDQIRGKDKDDLKPEAKPPEEQYEAGYKNVAERHEILTKILQSYNEDPEVTRRLHKFGQNTKPLPLLLNERNLYAVTTKNYPVIEDKTKLISLFEAIETGLLAWQSGVRPETATREERAMFIDASVAHHVILLSNLLLVGFKTPNYQIGSLTHLDLFDEGVLGLNKAIAGFNPAAGFEFSSYAILHINGAIKRAIANFSRTIRLPANAHDGWQKVKGEMNEFIQELGRDPNEEELVKKLAKVTGRSLTAAGEYLKATAYHIPSLNAPIDENNENTLGNEVANTRTEDTDVANQAVVRAMASAVFASKNIEPRDKLILALRFGVYRNIPELDVKHESGEPIDYKLYLGKAALSEGFTYGEIASVTGIAISSVKFILKKVLRNVAEILQDK